ncbi:MAG: hypothetical protein AAFU80_00905 [Pseudomonadota bacterium]
MNSATSRPIVRAATKSDVIDVTRLALTGIVPAASPHHALARLRSGRAATAGESTRILTVRNGIRTDVALSGPR